MTERRVYIVDDDEAMRDSLRFLLETSGLAVETFASAPSFLAAAPGLRGGCIVSDVRMPEMNGLQLVRRLTETGVHLPIVMITGHGDVPLAVEAMKAGVLDFIEKPFSDEAILGAIRSALAKSASDSEQGRQRADIAGRFGALTPREAQVMKGVVAGAANKEIAQALGISPRTVDIYRANVMAKMQAGSVSELVRMAIAVGVA